MKLQDLTETKKDMTGFVAKSGKKFYVDRTNLIDGATLVKPGEEIAFKYEGKMLRATVSDRGTGRDDDTYELDLIS